MPRWKPVTTSCGIWRRNTKSVFFNVGLAVWSRVADKTHPRQTKSREQRRQLEERVAQLQPALDAAVCSWNFFFDDYHPHPSHSSQNQDMERWKARCTSLESRVKQFGQALQGDGAGSHVPAPTPSSYRAQVREGHVKKRIERIFTLTLGLPADTRTRHCLPRRRPEPTRSALSAGSISGV